MTGRPAPRKPQAREHNAAVDELERSFRAGQPEAVEEFFGQVLALAEYPEGFPCDFQVAYRPDPRELVVEYHLPPATVIPVVRDYRLCQGTRRDRRAAPGAERASRACTPR